VDQLKKTCIFCLNPVEISQAENCIQVGKWGKWRRIWYSNVFFLAGEMMLEEHVMLKETDPVDG